MAYLSLNGYDAQYAPLAQLDRVAGFEPVGREFESLRVRHFIQTGDDTMSVRVRFAPSPTGHLHIGGARTALYNYCFAKSVGGKFILRIEDTDLERSRSEYEKAQIQDLHWLGLEYDEGPDRPGEYGPYRQSERLEIYKEYAQKLVDAGLAYYDFCTEQELQVMKEQAEKQGKPPHYNGKWRNPEFNQEAMARLAAGEKAAIRLRAPQKAYVLQDHVRGRVVFPENMVGDFIILRSSGLPVYNFCCVIDDLLMKITHVIRGEDHLSNTVRQLMVYEALGSKPPEFAHVSLLINKDRQKLSKRDGATSLVQYTNDGFLPGAIINYLTLLGWSHPEEKDIFDLKDLIANFDLNRFSKAAAIYDIAKFKWVNGQHIQMQQSSLTLKNISSLFSVDHPFLKLTDEQKEKICALFKTQVQFYQDFVALIENFIFQTELNETEKMQEVLSWPSTAQIAQFLSTQSFDGHLPESALGQWTEYLKKDLGIKGKQLFMGLRVCLTGKDQGPELVDLIPLTPASVLKQRLANIQKRLA